MKHLLFLFVFSITTAAWSVADDSLESSSLRPVSVRFTGIEQTEVPSFRRQVIPLMSRAGCSGRECHGSFSGQGGFHLSLFGYDFDKDHKEITDDQEEGVRIDRAVAEQSLVLLKPTLQVKHKGKERIKKDSWEYTLLRNWIQGGARNDAKETGDFDRLEVFPKEIVFQKPGESVQLRVLAHWKDGAVENVTELTRFRSNDDSVAAISDTGRVEAKEKGDTHVVAFYDNGILAVPVILPVTDQHGERYPQVAARTKVDELVNAKLRKLGILPSELCTDAEFLRRVSLDLAGTLPTPDEVTTFLADKSPNKRSAKVDDLLKSPSYAAWWTTKLCDFTGNTPRTLNNGAMGLRNYTQTVARQWYEWIYKRVANNVPYDQLAEGIILATSRTNSDQSYEAFAKEMAAYFRTDHPADFSDRPSLPYFWQRRNVTKPEEKALAFAHTFLGVRIECAQCHKHPFDQWTKMDFEQFQAFFEPVRFGGGPPRKDEQVTFQSVQKQMRELSMASTMSTNTTTPEDAKKAQQQAQQQQQKKLQDETQRRVEAGEVAPWQEVYVVQRPANRSQQKPQAKNQNSAGRVLTPKILGGEQVLLTQYNDPRQPLMDWLRDKANPYFARSVVNRLWANYFGRGIVEPSDDMNLANPPVNQELMEYLADGFVTHGYDMQWLHREIVTSDTYQRSWKTTPSNKLDEKNFSHFIIRRLPAEVAMDAIAMATSGAKQLEGFSSSIETRAIGPNVEAPPTGGQPNLTKTLTVFGRPTRETNCDCERTTDPTLMQTIFMRNDPELLGRLEAARNGQSAWIAELRQTFRPPRPARIKNSEKTPTTPSPELTGERLDETIAEVFLRTVSRPPTESEMTLARQDIVTTQDVVTGVRDLLWAMLNTREFMVNH